MLKQGILCVLTILLCTKNIHGNTQGVERRLLLKNQEARCPAPPKVDHGSFACHDLHKDKTCRLTCDKGYKPRSTGTEIYCRDAQHWTQPTHCEKIVCPPPPSVANGHYHCPASRHFYDTNCHLTCNRGFRRNKASIHCLANGSWSTAGICKALTTTPYMTRPTSMEILTTMVSSTERAPSISCEVCSGQLCGVVAGNIVISPHGKSYCLNNFEKEIDGSTIEKRCATKDECNKRWWLETSDKNSCVKVNPASLFGVKLSCTYCCTMSGCNKNTVPDRQTLFVGH